MAQDNGTPCIGSSISLISNHEIRYEGTLYAVDSNQCTIALSDVRSFGTENRATLLPVAPMLQVYDIIIFKAGDIKEMVLNENKMRGGTPFVDPAIVSFSERNATPASFTPLNMPPAGPMYNFMEQGDDYGWEHVPRRNIFSASSNIRQQRPIFPPLQSTTARRFPPPIQRMPAIIKSSAPPLKFDDDYDFEKANEQFQETLGSAVDKKAIYKKTDEDATNADSKDADSAEPLDKDDSAEKTDIHEKEEQKEEQTDATYYDKKSSFFDSISCENRDRGGGWKRDLRTNEETFGQEAARTMSTMQSGPGGFFNTAGMNRMRFGRF